MSDRLTTWQAVLQSQVIHPDWTAEIHAEWLEQEGYDLTALYGGTPAELIGRWLAENIAAGRAPQGSQATPAPAAPAAHRHAPHGNILGSTYSPYRERVVDYCRCDCRALIERAGLAGVHPNPNPWVAAEAEILPVLVDTLALPAYLVRRDDKIPTRAGVRTVTRVVAGGRYRLEFSGDRTGELTAELEPEETVDVLVDYREAPSPAQARAILAVVSAGGADVLISEIPGTQRTISHCRRHGWLDMRAGADGRAYLSVTTQGREALVGYSARAVLAG